MKTLFIIFSGLFLLILGFATGYKVAQNQENVIVDTLSQQYLDSTGEVAPDSVLIEMIDSQYYPTIESSDQICK